MIKFFRKIRQKLLSENKFSKYLLYAIGEIILVVAGILIALWINKLNNYETERIQEQKLLVSLLNDLNNDKEELEEDIDATNLIMKTMDSLIYNLSSNPDYKINDFGRHNRNFLEVRQFHNYRSAYAQSIATGNFALILSDSLRNQILQYYERHVISIGTDKKMEDINTNIFQQVWFNAIGASQEFVDAAGIKANLPTLNLEKVAQYPGFIESAIQKRTRHTLQINEYKRLMDYNKELKGAIKKELTERW